VDGDQLLGEFLRGALGRSGRKTFRKAERFLTGHKGFLTASTLMTAAGVAWGIYDSMKAQQGGSPPSAAPGGGAVVPPPLPGALTATATAPPGVPMDVLRLVRLAVSAARADGTLTPAERDAIVAQAQKAGIGETVAQELITPRPLAEIVSGVTEPAARQDLYALAFTIVRADEAVSGAERIYLAQLAHLLGLDPAGATRIEQDVAARIDATPA
jgi:uncharacterized membrane protein YebE (DUF533 family)